MSTKQRRVELKNCNQTVAVIQYITSTPLQEWMLFWLGVLRHRRQNACLHLLL